MSLAKGGHMSKRNTARVRRTFTPQFKKDALGLVNRGRSITEVARDLGIARSLLQRWSELEGRSEESGSGKASTSADPEDVRALRQKPRRHRGAGHPKKALAYFADDQK
jgi:transposase-like protein